MLTLTNVEYRYPRSSRKVFDNLNMHLESGRIYGLLGMNGAGKSTLLYLVSSLLLPQKGSILLNGMDVTKRTPDTLRDMFIVPEEYDLPNIKLEEYVKVNKSFYPLFNEERMYECVKAFHLPEDIKLGELSMGQKKKVYMCFALATGVKLILMDEPTNGMDIPSKIQFRKILRENVSEDTAILISTHQVKDVEQLLDTVVIIDNSEILYKEDMASIRQEQNLTEDGHVDLEMLFNNVIERNYGKGGAE